MDLNTAFFLMQGLSGLGTGISQANAMRASGEYQARMLLLNSEIQEFQADDAIKRGDKAAAVYRKQVAGLMGSQRVAAAAQGVQLGEGSAAEVQEDTAVRAAADAVTIRSDAWREAWGHRVQAQDFRGQAEFARIGSNFSANSALLTAGVNTLSSFTRAAGAEVSANKDESVLQRERGYFDGSTVEVSNTGPGPGRWGRTKDGDWGYGYRSMWD